MPCNWLPIARGVLNNDNPNCICLLFSYWYTPYTHSLVYIIIIATDNTILFLSLSPSLRWIFISFVPSKCIDFLRFATSSFRTTTNANRIPNFGLTKTNANQFNNRKWMKKKNQKILFIYLFRYYANFFLKEMKAPTRKKNPLPSW